MKRSFAAFVTAFAVLALPTAAVAAGQPTTPTHVEGRVVTATPAVLTIATPEGVQQFDITPESKVPADLNPNEQVEVTYRNATEGHMSITEVKRKQVPMESAKESSETNGATTAGLAMVTGNLYDHDPNYLWLSTDNGIQKFRITDQSDVPSRIADGTQLDLWYRPATEGGEATLVRTSVHHERGATQTSSTTSWSESQSQTGNQGTRPAVESSSSSSSNENAMTATGTLQSFNSEQLVLDTGSGTQQFTMQPTTTRPYDLQAGDQVKLAYVNGSNDRRLVQNVEVTRHATSPQRMAAMTRRTELPQTGSRLPLIGLIGVLAVAGAAAIRLTLRS